MPTTETEGQQTTFAAVRHAVLLRRQEPSSDVAMIHSGRDWAPAFAGARRIQSEHQCPLSTHDRPSRAGGRNPSPDVAPGP